MKMFGTMKIESNNISIGGVIAKDIVNKYGTPVYVYDEELILNNIRDYKTNFCNGNENKVAYAGKAFLTLAMCKILKDENMSLDVVSGGELYTAYKSGFPLENVYFHGNNKTIDEIKMGIDLKVGRFVVDNLYEMEEINKLASEESYVQKILLRVTPGIEAHTHEYIKTGQIDSKFGFTIVNDKLIQAVKKAIELPNIELMGIHCHIGSQIFEIEPFIDAVEVMMNLIKNIKDDIGYELQELDLGGGFGIYYKEGDLPVPTKLVCEKILKKAKLMKNKLDINMPRLIIEPGRSIVGNAGTTLYTVGSIKRIEDVRKYVAVDGGMTDNIRPALYKAEYECVIANRVDEEKKETVTISGKCCESSDILLSNVLIPKAKSGDVLAVLSTGAYGYSMSSNYNKIRRAAVIMANKGDTRLICERQSYEDLIRGEI
ncbi:MAG: diaminopimelate decarboxylase [Clostridiaceae bacterium]